MTTNDYRPKIAIHPSEHIKDELQARGLSQKDFAALMGMKPSNVSRMLKGEDITVDTAEKLEIALGIPADLWLRLQLQYNRYAKDIAEREKEGKRKQARSSSSSFIPATIPMTASSRYSTSSK